MPQRDQEVVVSSGAGGLGAAVASEAGASLGELEAIRARGYCELVWRGFRRAKTAIACGLFIILLIAIAFGGVQLAKHFTGLGPTDFFAPGCCPGGDQPVSLLGLRPANPR